MADYVLTAGQLYPEAYACRGGCGRFTEWPDDWCEECDTDDGSDGSDDDWPCIYPGDDNHMSDPLLDIAAQAMYAQDAQDSMSSASWQDLAEGERDEWRRIAEAGIAALRDAKRLLPEHVNAVVVATTEAAEGFTERVEWGSLEHGEVVTWGIGGEKQARANAKWLRETDPDAKVMRRYVYIGPWEVASE